MIASLANRPSRLAFGPVVALVVATSPAARAYCRTTTDPAPAGYDPASVGDCWLGDGGPIQYLAWPLGSNVPYSLSQGASKQVSLSEATRIADLAFAAWNATSCSSGPLGVQTYDNGPVPASEANTDCGVVQCAPTVHDSLHVILFRDDGWPYNDPVQTLALTTVTFGVDTGTIYDADIEINSSDPSTHPLTTQEPPPPGSYDLQAILTHEAGHFLGLAHATDTHAIMYAYYSPGSILLQPDDIAGVCSAYPPVIPGGGACSEAPGRPVRSGVELVLAFGLAACWGARRRALSAAGRSRRAHSR